MIAFRRHSTARCHPKRQFGNYRLVRWLGDGGFAEVYLRKHIYLGTLAAVKILRAGLADADVQAFFDEARIAARLVHPHIVRVLEFGVEGRIPFLVMDYAPKGTLHQHYLPGSRLVPKVILKYMQQAANAVQYIHDQDLVHRDIKPENLLLGHHNELWLSDFGIAIAAHKPIDGECMRVGTIAYMAPEQIEGNPCIDDRDLWRKLGKQAHIHVKNNYLLPTMASQYLNALKRALEISHTTNHPPGLLHSRG